MLITFEHIKKSTIFFTILIKSMFNLVNIKLITWEGGRKFESYSNGSIQVYTHTHTHTHTHPYMCIAMVFCCCITNYHKFSDLK